MELNDPVEVYSTNNQNEAEIIRAALLGEGIACQITGEGQAGLAGIGTMEITIVVRAADYDRARAFIEEHQRAAEEEP
ncbi:MAG TPA: DUF2007 domain-containing protein [Pirellulales bacterium]|jgi:hypothetical protein|nr:DUF2007 domain-containing protein [Pirellulales bacterium]